MDNHENLDLYTDDDEPQNNNIFGRLPTGSGAEQESASGPSEATPGSANIRSSPPESDRPSIFSSLSTSSNVPSPTPDTPTPSSRPMTYHLPSSRPLATLAQASSSKQTRRTRFLDGDISIIGDAALPQAEKDGDDPSTPVDTDGTGQSRDYNTPAALTRLLASHAVDDSRSQSYTLGNPNLVRPCKAPTQNY
jgi:hypothetical protein